MSVYWRKEIVRIHQNQFPLRKDAFNYLRDFHGLDRKIPLGESRFLPLTKNFENEKLKHLQLELGKLTDLLTSLPPSWIDKEFVKDVKGICLRVGHQRRNDRLGGEFVIYTPQWFLDQFCIKGSSDYFLPKVEVKEDGIYLYPLQGDVLK